MIKKNRIRTAQQKDGVGGGAMGVKSNALVQQTTTLGTVHCSEPCVVCNVCSLFRIVCRL